MKLENDYSKFNREGTLLRKQQLRMLEMMVEVDKICRKNKIPYWLASGTALGAVRHGGFIPWDDDLDIEVLRTDYKHLLMKLNEELPKSMVLQTTMNDKNYISQFAKVRDVNSEILENGKLNGEYRYKGIFIDIFPVETIPSFFSKLSAKLHYLLYKLSWKKNDELGIKLLLQRLVLFVLQSILYPFFRLFSVFATKDVLRLPLGVGFFSKRIYSEIFPLKEIDFEGFRFFIPIDTDAYLRRLYGDYMKMPPIDKIKQHIVEVNFKTYDEE